MVSVNRGPKGSLSVSISLFVETNFLGNSEGVQPFEDLASHFVTEKGLQVSPGACLFFFSASRSEYPVGNNESMSTSGSAARCFCILRNTLAL